jgi:hypothetical protein
VLQNLIGSWKGRRAAKQLERNPIYGPIVRYARAVLNDRSQGIGKVWSEDGKRKLLEGLLADVAQVLAEPNPAQAVRMRAIEFMLIAAQFDVLIMQPPTPFKGLSGELKPRIPELAKKDKELEEFFYGIDPAPTTFDGMWDSVLMRYWAMNLNLNSYNQARVALGDWHDDRKKDWFRPCYTSLCIWQENTYRRQLGLPSVIGGDLEDLKAIMHSTWINRAKEGHKELRLVWEKSWEEAFKEPSPYHGLAM